MLHIYANSLLEATRSSKSHTPPDIRKRAAANALYKEQAERVWWRRPYWV